MCTLKLDDEAASEDVRCGHEGIHDSTQARLAKALEYSALPSKVVPTSTKVDTALSGWFGQLTLEPLNVFARGQGIGDVRLRALVMY